MHSDGFDSSVTYLYSNVKVICVSISTIVHIIKYTSDFILLCVFFRIE